MSFTVIASFTIDPSNKAAFEAGVVLESLTPVRASLEDTFFEMTGN